MVHHSSIEVIANQRRYSFFINDALMEILKMLRIPKPVHDFGPLQSSGLGVEQAAIRRPRPLAKIFDETVLLRIEVDVEQ